MKRMGGFFTALGVSAALLCAVQLSACDSTSIARISAAILNETPTAENTLTDMAQVSDTVLQALMNGDAIVTFNTGVPEADVGNVSERLGNYWGWPTQYRVISYGEMDLGDGRRTNINRISMDLYQSVNYYVYNKYLDPDFTIPAEYPSTASVRALSNVLPQVIAEIFPQGVANLTAYEQILEVHDWLVAKISYDESISAESEQNGAYGALIDRRTMCQGYAEAFQLILQCATDIRVNIQFGQALNDDGWGEHAWNIVYLDGHWYQFDVTYDDPAGNEDGEISRCYFGQNDQSMAADHRWVSEYWPAADGADFLYYRMSGLYADDYEEFEELLTVLLKNREPTEIELATRAGTITDEQLQFIFDTNSKIKTVYNSVTDVGDGTVYKMSFEYE